MTQERSVPLTQRRRQRVPADEIRELMFNAAHTKVTELGVTASLEDLSMEDLIRDAGVPRGSVYRIWPYRGDFIGDLLEKMAGPEWFGTGSYDSETLRLAVETLFKDKTLFSTAEGRRKALLETIRVAADRNYRYTSESAEWKIYMALIATSGGAREPETRARVAAALARSDGQFTSTMAKFYQAMASLIGFRLRDSSYSFEHLAVAGAAVVEGLAMRRVLVATAKEVPAEDFRAQLEVLVSGFVAGPDQTGEPNWSLAALGFLGVFDALVESVPDDEYDHAVVDSLEAPMILAMLEADGLLDSEEEE